MLTNPEHANAITLQVVRGVRPLRDLETAGIRFLPRPDGSQEVISPNDVAVKVGPADIAEGLSHYRGADDALQAWARTILLGSAFIDLDLEGHPSGDVLLEALWQASFGHAIGGPVFDIAEVVRQHGRSNDSVQ